MNDVHREAAPAGPETGRRRTTSVALLATVTAAGLLWVWWPALRDMVARWSIDPRYSHGFLVPLFAGFLLWHRRDRARAIVPGAYWPGTLLIALGLLLNLAGTYYYVVWLEGAALLPAVAGLVLLVGGWPALRWAWPAIVFLIFMIPLPFRLEHALGQPLQQVATKASTFTLQTLGLPAVAEGSIIVIGEHRIGVVEACNGLGMLVMFVAFSLAVALLIERPLLDKLLILLSALPTAVLANVIRITITGVLHTTVSERVGEMFYHDLAGWLMMPLALGILWLEIEILARLFLEAPAPAAVPVPIDWAHPPLAGLGGRGGTAPKR